MADATLKEVMAFFGMEAKEFQVEWRKLTTEDKAQFKAGIGDGTYTY